MIPTVDYSNSNLAGTYDRILLLADVQRATQVVPMVYVVTTSNSLGELWGPGAAEVNAQHQLESGQEIMDWLDELAV